MASSRSVRPGVKAALFEPGERLGWVFRDRRDRRETFDEPPPADREDAPWERNRVALLLRARRAVLLAGAGLTAVCFAGYLVALAGYRLAVAAQGAVPLDFGTRFTLTVWGISIAGPLLLVVGLPLWLTARIGRALRGRERAWAGWEARLRDHQRSEEERVEQLMEWGAATVLPQTRRIEIFGGTLWSWEAFLTTYGASAVRVAAPVILLDLSEELVSDELFQLTRQAGFRVDRQVLPAELPTSDLLSGLSPEQIVDVLVESLHGGTQEDDRSERAMDQRVLTAVCGELGTNLSMARLAEALRALMGEPGTPRLLTAAEWDRVASGLFSDAYVQQAHDRLRRMEASIHQLVDLGTRTGRREGGDRLRCVAIVNEGTDPFGDLLMDLVVHWTMRRIAGSDASGCGALIVAGADRLQRRHLERLSDICERRNVRLVYLFRHLREQTLQVLGGGAVGFMRLGNHEEAERAAGFIGREYRFTVSSISRGLNGGETHSTGSNYGEGDSAGSNQTRGFLFDPTVGYTRGTSRNWGLSYQYSEQTGWSYQSTDQRVYEYRVEPRTLQDLPEYALLVVESRPTGPALRAVECNPDILSLPRATTDELPGHDGRLDLDQLRASREAEAPSRR